MARSSRITVKKTGDYKAVVKKFEDLPMHVQQAANIALGESASKGERIAVKHIKNQDLKWAPLSKAYLRSKTKKGLSEKKLIATSSYFQAITSIVVKGHAFIGVKRGVYETQEVDEDGKNKSIEIANLALIMEYGSIKRNIKPRKLWKPTMLELIKWIRDSGIFVKEIKKKI